MTPKQTAMLLTEREVLAILNGRKIQTRIPIDRLRRHGKVSHFRGSTTHGYDFQFRCRRGLWQDYRAVDFLNLSSYGGVGDLIWGRETWRPIWNECGCTETPCDCFDLYVRYAADGGVSPSFNDADVGEWNWPKAAGRGNVSSPLMPMWASRLWLEITNVRVERVNAITEEDAVAEGAKAMSVDDLGGTWQTHQRGFESGWVTRYGQESWDKGWCWVYDFKRVGRPE